VTGPSEDLRRKVGDMVLSLKPSIEDEAGLERVLSEEIGPRIRDDIGNGSTLPSQDPAEVLAAVEAWAGLVSFAVGSFYGPQSPPKVPGWAQNIPQRLRELTGWLLQPLEIAARALGATSWTISVNVPFGVSIGLGWP
jgi:hypothetical protein